MFKIIFKIVVFFRISSVIKNLYDIIRISAKTVESYFVRLGCFSLNNTISFYKDNLICMVYKIEWQPRN